jgi:hypothetical protein
MTEQTILALSGPATAAAWFFANMFLKERSREVAKEVLAEAIKSELSIFKGQFLKELNGTYRRSGECVLTMSAVKEKLTEVDHHLEMVDEFAHEARRELVDKYTGLAMHIREAGPIDG